MMPDYRAREREKNPPWPGTEGLPDAPKPRKTRFDYNLELQSPTRLIRPWHAEQQWRYDDRERRYRSWEHRRRDLWTEEELKEREKLVQAHTARVQAELRALPRRAYWEEHFSNWNKAANLRP